MKAFFLVLLMGFSVLSNAATLNKVVVFGDSLSDNGNLYEYMKHQFPSSPPYYEGRMTNGPVWAELLVDSYFTKQVSSHLLDYAYAGASVEEENDQEPIFTLRSEIDSYLLSHQGLADENTLYILWIGANNYLALPDNQVEAVKLVNDGIERGLQQLASKGAKHVLVLNLPDLGRTPVAREFDAVSLLTDLTTAHNGRLLNLVEELKQRFPAVQWLHFDVKFALDEMLTNPAESGFTNVIDSCLDSAKPEPSLKSALKIASTVEIADPNEAQCEGYLFFDLVHPSGLAHQILSTRIQNLLALSDIQFAENK